MTKGVKLDLVLNNIIPCGGEQEFILFFVIKKNYKNCLVKAKRDKQL